MAQLRPVRSLLACIILAALFYFQSRGTMEIGSVFGPVMLVWFATLGVLGAWYISKAPSVLKALNPEYGLALLHNPPAEVAAMLGSIVHRDHGRGRPCTRPRPLRAQGHHARLVRGGVSRPHPELLRAGAYLTVHPNAKNNPFFAMAPDGVRARS